MMWMTLSPPSPTKIDRFCSDSTPIMNSTEATRVCQPRSSSRLERTATAYTSSNHRVESDHMSSVKAWFPSINCFAMPQSHGACGPYNSRRCGSSRRRKSSQVPEKPIRTTAV